MKSAYNNLYRTPTGKKSIVQENSIGAMLPLQAEGTYTIIGVFTLPLIAGSTGYWVYLDGTNRGAAARRGGARMSFGSFCWG